MDIGFSDPSPTTEEAPVVEADARSVGVFPPPRKLSAEQERALTHLYAETRTPIADIARTFGLSEVSVGRIAQRNGAPSRRRRGAARETTPDAPAAPANGRRGRRRRAEVATEAVEATGGEEQAQQRRVAGAEPQGRGRRPRAPVSDGAAAAHVLPAASASAAEMASETAGGGARRRFRIRFFAETVVEAADLREALGQAEALGATDITGIVQEDS